MAELDGRGASTLGKYSRPGRIEAANFRFVFGGSGGLCIFIDETVDNLIAN